MYKYAKINESGVVIGTQESTNEIIDNSLILVGEYPLMGSVYNPAVGGWDTPTPVIIPTPSIRIITSRALKKRLFVTERDAIRNSTDKYIQDIWYDLNDSGYVDLDDSDLSKGIAYVTNYLTTIPSFQNANVMTVINPSVRLTELLVDGQSYEKYNGVL